jgi:hypothetical protein
LPGRAGFFFHPPPYLSNKFLSLELIDMAVKLNEWASGKADYVANRVYTLLQKYTGIKFKVYPSFHAYKNKWGMFFGKFALGSNGRYYRLNFTRAATDEIVSMDVWQKGQDALEKLPAYTCSFEGYGVSRVISMLKDFILTPDKVLTEGLAPNEESAFANILREDSRELKTFIAAFLQENPAWQQNWASGTVDDKQYFKASSQWIKQAAVSGTKYSGNPVLTTIALVSNTKSLIKSNPQVIGVSSATQAKGVITVPSVAVTKSSAAGMETPVDMSDAYAEKVTFDQIQNILVNSPKGPLQQMALMKESISDLFEMGDLGETMVVIWGRGGIGKTYTFLETMEELGLSENEHWIDIPPSLNRVSPGGLQKFIIEHADKDFLRINDNDDIFKPQFMNTWKQVLEHDHKHGRKLRIAYVPGTVRDKDAPQEGTYDINCKFVWLSNVDPDLWIEDPSGAMKSRYISVEYDFTDTEVMEIIADRLGDLYSEYNDILTPDDKAQIFNIFYKTALKRKTQGKERTIWISFRQFNDTLEKWVFNKRRGVSFETFKQKYLNAKLNIAG